MRRRTGQKLLRFDRQLGAMYADGRGVFRGLVSSLLEETGSYAFATAHPQGTTTNAQALADDVPLQIDGTCCYNAQPGAKTKP